MKFLIPSILTNLVNKYFEIKNQIDNQIGELKHVIFRLEHKNEILQIKNDILESKIRILRYRQETVFPDEEGYEEYLKNLNGPVLRINLLTGEEFYEETPQLKEEKTDKTTATNDSNEVLISKYEQWNP